MESVWSNRTMITPSFSLTATERVLPKLALDFTTAVLDPRITFTRTTNASNPATYVNSSGVITLATNNQPRFDYDPITLVCKGLLIEESRNNACVYSGDLSQSGVGKWNPTSVGTGVTPTVTGAYALAPDGTMTATRLQLSLGGGTTTNDQSVHTQVVTQSSAWGSFYLKTTDGTTKTVYVRGAAATSVTIDGTWRRYTFNAGNMSGSQFAVGLRGGQTPTNSNTADILVWGAQCESGAFATSYIPTEASALTRNADIATMTGTNFSDWYSNNGSVYCEFTPVGITAKASLYFYNGINSGESNFLYNVTNALYFRSRSSGSTQATLNAGANSFVAGQTVKAVAGWKDSDFGLARDGNAATTASSGTVSTAITQLDIGELGVSNTYRKIMFWPQKLTTNEIRAFSK